ncbi:head GIN domain-containing protein [Olleya namhaensis]|uniref:head GIN domain-containing protein n=1 Tax=Olleya namhaensis TaxID=1144750 RepID=UPI002490ADE1|nr:head GIN domain-containing protein [Olleya namhaensis]
MKFSAHKHLPITNAVSKTLKQTLLLALTLVTISSCNAQWGNGKKIKGNGNVTTITRSTSDYDAIRLAGWMDFELVKGTEGTITIEGEENLLDYIITEVESNGLVIKIENNTNLKPSGKNKIKITVPFEDIDKLTLSGSGDVTSNATFYSKNFETKVSGSGDVTLDVEATNVKASVTGSGDLTITGTTKNLEASVTGSGDIHAERLKSDNADVKVTGSGGIEVYAKDSLKAKVTGSGDIDYKGNPSNVNKKVTGSGDISN